MKADIAALEEREAKGWIRSIRQGDMRPDWIVKKQLLWEIRKEFDPLIAIDDRNSVVKMWREEGIQCLQAAEGDF